MNDVTVTVPAGHVATLREYAILQLGGEASDLGLTNSRPGPEAVEKALANLATVQGCAGLLDQLGWVRRSTEVDVTVTIPGDILEGLLGYIEEGAFEDLYGPRWTHPEDRETAERHLVMVDAIRDLAGHGQVA